MDDTGFSLISGQAASELNRPLEERVVLYGVLVSLTEDQLLGFRKYLVGLFPALEAKILNPHFRHICANEGFLPEPAYAAASEYLSREFPNKYVELKSIRVGMSVSGGDLEMKARERLDYEL